MAIVTVEMWSWLSGTKIRIDVWSFHWNPKSSCCGELAFSAGSTVLIEIVI